MQSGNRGFKAFALLTLSTVGVVYGDIGTSPLYALREVFLGHHPIATSAENVLGALSLFFWSLTIVVALKYHILVLRIDNQGEGGVFALLAIIKQAKLQGRLTMIVSGGLILGACLLYADGLITPAISVLSALEGIEVATPALSSWVIPLTIAILIGLFLVQKHGTTGVGRFFGPIMVVWFVSLIVIAWPYVWSKPEVFNAVNPMYAIHFLAQQGIGSSMFILGSVFLCVTGGEALYADLGHFGKHAIDTAWFILVYPALVFNYFGQGAYLLSHDVAVGSNLFYLLPSDTFLIPMVILATMATIIASQAMISGAFSLTQQAIGLGFFPRLKIVHTSASVHGQIYMPAINWLLCAGCVALVLTFKSSGALASAYGITVTATMTITTMGFFLVTTRIRRWPVFWVAPLCAGLFMIDLSFFVSNAIKFLDGGFVPVTLGFVICGVMLVWSWGKKKLSHVYAPDGMTVADLMALKDVEWKPVIPRRIHFFSPSPVTSESSLVPLTLQTFVSRIHVLPRELSFVTVKIHNQPYVEGPRVEHYTLRDDVRAVVIHYGYMEDPDIVTILERHEIKGNIVVGDHEIFSEHEHGLHYLQVRWFRLLLRLSLPSYRYFGVQRMSRIMKEVIPVEIGKKGAVLLDVDY